MQNFIKINEKDNVAVALEGNKEIPAGHKMALGDIPAGAPVIKYGYTIGYAKEDIPAGAWVHTHNLKTGLGEVLEYIYEPMEIESGEKKISVNPGKQMAVEDGRNLFQGFVRPDGKVGVRNEIWVIPTVGCMNNVATSVARQANSLRKGSVREVIAFPHPYGCSQMGDDQEYTRTILADLVNHPNAGGVLVLGLGCENSSTEILKNYIGEYDARRVKFLVAQDLLFLEC